MQLSIPTPVAYHRLEALDAALSLLNWDRAVTMPQGGSAARTQHSRHLTAIRHEVLNSQELRLWSESLQTQGQSSEELAMGRVLQRRIDQETRMPAELVDRKTRVANESYEVWKSARAHADFGPMVPYYKELFEIAKERSRCLRPDGPVYDALIDIYEEDATQADARVMFDAIGEPIREMLQSIAEAPPVDDSLLHGEWDERKLRDVAESITRSIGFDYQRGRLDIAPNAFCSNQGRDDVRMTTRPSNHLKGILSSSLHEMGHALYEQNSPAEWEGTPLSGGISLAVHESQSRLWENIVGRSDAFWHHFHPLLAHAFPVVRSLGAQRFAAAYRRAEPTLIRVGADELSYNLHILVRFEMEVGILEGDIKIEEMPAAWNELYQRYLGITPPDNGLGCLQDVHWSKGSIGYFPTYAMGNLIGAHMWKHLEADLEDVDGSMREGRFADILEWLIQKVYRKGRLMKPRDLVLEVNGAYLDPNPWLEYARGRYLSSW